MAQADLRQFPSATTLYRHRLTLHVGFLGMLKKANDEVGRCAVYISSDSSPVAQQDWLNTLVCRIPYDRLDECWQDSELLLQHGTDSIHDGEVEELDVRLFEASTRLQRWLRLRPCTPVGIGSGAGTAKHKMHALLHQLFLESDWQGVCSVLNSTVAFTTDGGVERLLQAFPPFNVTTFMPWAADVLADDIAFDFQCDVGNVGEGAENSPAGVQDGAGRLDFQWASDIDMFEGPLGLAGVESLPDGASADGPDMSEEPQHEHGPDGGESDHDPPRDHADDELGGAHEALRVDTSRSLSVLGILHVVHNAVKELHNAMSHWATFTEDLKLLCDLCRRPWSKDRLLQTCFADPPQSNFKGLYIHFRPMSTQAAGGAWPKQRKPWGLLSKALLSRGV